MQLLLTKQQQAGYHGYLRSDFAITSVTYVLQQCHVLMSCMLGDQTRYPSQNVVPSLKTAAMQIKSENAQLLNSILWPFACHDSCDGQGLILPNMQIYQAQHKSCRCGQVITIIIHRHLCGNFNHPFRDGKQLVRRYGCS